MKILAALFLLVYAPGVWAEVCTSENPKAQFTLVYKPGPKTLGKITMQTEDTVQTWEVPGFYQHEYESHRHYTKHFDGYYFPFDGQPFTRGAYFLTRFEALEKEGKGFFRNEELFGTSRLVQMECKR